MDSMVFFQVSSWMPRWRASSGAAAPATTCSAVAAAPGSAPRGHPRTADERLGRRSPRGENNKKSLFGSKWELRFFSAWVILHFQQKDPGHSVQKFWNVEKKYLQVKFENLQWEFEEISNGNCGQKKNLHFFFCGLRYKAFTVVQQKILMGPAVANVAKSFPFGMKW